MREIIRVNRYEEKSAEIDLEKSRWCNEFLSGQDDCKEGVEHKSGMPEAYDKGYGAEYESAAASAEFKRWNL